MAKIEMDISEYEKMKEIDGMLKASLKEKEALHLEIQALTKEKLLILKEAEKQVIITTNKTITETVYAYHPPREIISRIQRYLEDTSRRGLLHGQTMSDQGDFHQYLDMFFQRTTNELKEGTTTVVKGLDEYLVTYRRDIEKDIDAETKEKLKALSTLRKAELKRTEDFEEISKVNKNLNLEVNKNIKDILDFKKTIEEQGDDIEECLKENKILRGRIIKFNNKVNTLPSNIFNNGFKQKVLTLITVETDD